MTLMYNLQYLFDNNMAARDIRQVIVALKVSGSGNTTSLQGVILTTHQMVKELIEKTTTISGLKVFACIFNKVYETGLKLVNGFKESMRIIFDDYLGQWNYVVPPIDPILKVG